MSQTKLTLKFSEAVRSAEREAIDLQKISAIAKAFKRIPRLIRRPAVTQVKYDLFTVLNTKCGVDAVLAKNIEDACNKLRIGEEGRKRIAQAVASNAVNECELHALIYFAPNLFFEPRE